MCYPLWKIQTSPRVQVFPWLLSHNKLTATDNLIKRINMFKPVHCQLCKENESSIPHFFFFECVVARNMRIYVNNDHFHINVQSYEDMACKWPCGGKYEILNCISAGVCWGIWLTRNDMICRQQNWQSIKIVLRTVWKCMAACMETYAQRTGVSWVRPIWRDFL